MYAIVLLCYSTANSRLYQSLEKYYKKKLSFKSIIMNYMLPTP